MRILVVKLSSLGDLFHALPAVRALKVGCEAEIDWVTQREYVSLVECFDDVERVIPFYRRGFPRGFPELWHGVRREPYDMAIDLQGLLKSAFITRLARARRRIGPSFHREGAVCLYDAVAGPRNRERHAVQEALDIARHLELAPMDPTFGVTFPELTLEGSGPRIGLIPASRWPSKNWPAQHFAAAAKALREQTGAEIYAFGAPGDVALCADIANAAGDGVTNLAGKTSLVEMGSHLAAMDLVIGNDSGPMHMAVATGTPTLMVFGPTDERRTGPVGDIHAVVRADIPCMPCFERRCRVHGRPCLEDLAPERVVDRALTMLQKESV